MDRNITYIILAFNMAAAILYYVLKKCEIPFFLALFNWMVEYRIISLQSGYGTWVEFNYGIDFNFSFETAYIASSFILLGVSIMMYSFMIIYKRQVKQLLDSNELLKSFILSKRNQIIIGLCLFTLIQLGASSSAPGGYAFLTKLGNSSFIIFLYLLMTFTGNRKLTTKIFFLALFAGLAYLTYDTGLRFQFLGWMIPVCFYLARNIKPGLKVMLAFGGIFFILVVFSAAGVLRYKDINSMTLSELYNESYERMMVAEDVNFIDGFIMLYKVYPELLDYNYGLEHLNIILRPIPRSLWPDKPLASWVRNYEAKYNGEVKESAGFSPTIWGVFYSEIGVIGIVSFSILWAWFLAYLYRSFSSFKSDLSVVLIGILISSMIPIFRSGDLAGDFAIVLMSYWPVLIFVKQYKKFVKIKLRQMKGLQNVKVTTHQVRIFLPQSTILDAGNTKES